MSRRPEASSWQRLWWWELRRLAYQRSLAVGPLLAAAVGSLFSLLALSEAPRGPVPFAEALSIAPMGCCLVVYGMATLTVGADVTVGIVPLACQALGRWRWYAAKLAAVAVAGALAAVAGLAASLATSALWAAGRGVALRLAGGDAAAGLLALLLAAAWALLGGGLAMVIGGVGALAAGLAWSLAIENAVRNLLDVRSSLLISQATIDVLLFRGRGSRGLVGLLMVLLWAGAGASAGLWKLLRSDLRLSSP